MTPTRGPIVTIWLCWSVFSLSLGWVGLDWTGLSRRRPLSVHLCLPPHWQQCSLWSGSFCGVHSIHCRVVNKTAEILVLGFLILNTVCMNKSRNKKEKKKNVFRTDLPSESQVWTLPHHYWYILRPSHFLGKFFLVLASWTTWSTASSDNTKGQGWPLWGQTWSPKFTAAACFGKLQTTRCTQRLECFRFFSWLVNRIAQNPMQINSPNQNLLSSKGR